MFSLNGYKTVFMAMGLIGVIVCCVPTVVRFAPSAGGETFSELYVLGPTHNASDYPFNVSEGRHYMVYLGVGNHMSGSVYYEVEVKFRNSSEPLPNATTGESSSLPVLYRYRVFLRDGGVWEAPLKFSLLNVVFGGHASSVGRLDVNGVVADVDKVAMWDNETKGFYYQVFVELWRYNVTTRGIAFDSRFVGFWLNATSVS